MALMEWWEVAKAAVVAAYTGMTPAAFFTIMAVSAALYVVAVSGLLARLVQAPRRREEEDAEERAFQPLPLPVQQQHQLGAVTEEELRAYDGSDPKKPLLMAINGQIYDVTRSRMFYGPGGPYTSFAGRNASRALAKMSLEPSDLTGDISGLSPLEVEASNEWEYKFKSKYVTVGTIQKTVPVAKGDAYAAGRTVTAERDISESTIDSNHEPEQAENSARKRGSILGKTKETLDVDVNTISHKDTEKANQLTDLQVSIRTDALEQEETANVAVRNNSGTLDAADTKDTSKVVDEKNMSKPEDAIFE